MINQGEIDEALVKLKLIDLRSNLACINICGVNSVIRSVGFDEEYGSLPHSVDLLKIEKQANAGNTSALTSLASCCGITKAKSTDKADVYINNEGWSIKSFQGSSPAIANHTSRFGWERIAREKGLNIVNLDKIISDYWEKRTNGIIGEDISSIDPESPFKDAKETLRPFINYFLYEGTGHARSEHPAAGVLSCKVPLNVNTWQFHRPDEYFDEIWNNLIFSVRHKGIENYPECKNYLEIEPWVRYFQGSYKGTLHVRVKK